jgi:hypothetical protein
MFVTPENWFIVPLIVSLDAISDISSLEIKKYDHPVYWNILSALIMTYITDML